jgi:tetratricopeptide (TPR) repeat protein
MLRSALLRLGLALSVVDGAAGCGATLKLAYTPDELRAEVARRAPALPPRDVLVPFELTPEWVERAQQIVQPARSVGERVRLLAEALAEGGSLGVRYAAGATTSAEEALRTSAGNCTALASLFIGLARAVGLTAYYIDASTRVHETRYGDDGMTVNAGHITALVENGVDMIGLDFERLGRIRWYRIIDDVEALAHLYNNRGFDLIDDARERSLPVDWAAAARQFLMATQVVPNFARAWNNLGIAASHLGRVQEAIQDYRTAIAKDPKLAAPYNNLGSLYLATGDARAALEALTAAASLEPTGPHIQYNLAIARLRQGDRQGAIEAARRAIDLRGRYPDAQALLERLSAAPPRRL